MSITTDKVDERLVDFLEKKKNEIIDTWFKSRNTYDKSVYGEKVKENSQQFYELILKSLRNPLSEEEIQTFAYKMAHEMANQRTETTINIGEIVHHISIGRTVLFDFIHQEEISFDEGHKELIRISRLFDLFIFYTVSKNTEIRELELQDKVLFINQTHKDRLTLLGQMSSSFVHEFRNPLTSVMGFIKLLKDGPHNKMYLDIIDYELEQLNFRITQFLHTSKREIKGKDKEEVKLESMITDMLDFIYPSIVDVDCELGHHIESDLKVFAYSDELKQVLQNILLNSIDEVKEHEKPRIISIKCGIEKEQAVIRIANNGPMIPEKTIETIFEPFFTTKELGTGIGLYVCKKIIEKHNGHIICESKNDWTTFSILLPLNV